MVELFAQLALVHKVGQRDIAGAVDQGKGDRRVGLVAKDRLAHQQLVEIRVDQGPDDRVDLPLVVPDAGGDVDHLRPPVELPGRLNQRGAALASTGWGAGRGKKGFSHKAKGAKRPGMIKRFAYPAD